MAALACTTVTLLQDSKCIQCFTENELLAAEALLREQLDADADTRAVRTISQLRAAAISWIQLSQHVLQAIEVRQLCQTAVDAAARTSCDADDLKAEIKCFCGLGPDELRAIIAYLKCQAR